MKKTPEFNKRGVFFAFFLLLMFPAAAFAHKLPAGFKGFRSSASCRPCHLQIYNEWSMSMHSMSGRSSDPAHDAVFRAFSQSMAKAGKKAPYFCGSCHNPAAGRPASGRLASGAKEAYSSNPGIPCAFCHSVEGMSGGKLFNTYALSTSMTSAGAVSGVSAPHPVSKWSFNSPSQMCLGCHGKMKNGRGTVICSMDMEGHSDCVKCHMPKTPGAPAAYPAMKKTDIFVKDTHFSHLFPGGHYTNMLKAGISLSLEVNNGMLSVNIKNANPHYFPSTSPMRAAYVKVEFLDKNGKVLFASPAPMPGKKELFMRVFTAGPKKGVPPWMAEKAVDSRIKSGETRTLTYAVPKGSARARAVLYYRLFTPAAAAKFGIPARMAKPVKVTETGINID